MAGARLGLSCLIVLGFDAEVDWLYLLGRHLGLRAEKTCLNNLPSGPQPPKLVPHTHHPRDQLISCGRNHTLTSLDMLLGCVARRGSCSGTMAWGTRDGGDAPLALH